jgi:Ca2+-transporting ATPase
MNAVGSKFFTSEVMKNRYVWYAVLACLVLLFISYQIEVVRRALDIFPMSKEDWMISVGMSLLSLVVIQIVKSLKLVRQ